MAERTRSLRIAAGVLILIAVVSYLGFSLAEAVRAVGNHFRSIVSSFVSSTTEWMICGAALTLTAIFAFAKKFIGSGVAMCVAAGYWLYMIVRQLLFGASVFGIMNLAFSFLLLASSVLAAVGFFRRRKSSRTLFVIAAVLTLLAVAAAMIFMLGFAADIFGLPRDMFLDSVKLGVISYIPDYLPTIIAWILLAAYFGAQQESAPGPRRGRAPQNAPQYAPQYGRQYPPQYTPQSHAAQGYAPPQAPARPGGNYPEPRQ